MASPEEIKNALLEWLTDNVRIDELSIDLPTNTSTVINSERYPPNKLTAYTPYNVSFDRVTIAETSCKCTWVFGIDYRFPKALAYELLPWDQGLNLVANLSILAIKNFKDIHEDIQDIRTLEQESPVTVAPIEEVSDDWIMRVGFTIQTEFMLDVGNTDKLQPGAFTTDLPLYTLDWRIWRSLYPVDIENPDSHTQHSSGQVNFEPPLNVEET